MIPADIDPSLSSSDPRRERLDDGFSPPPVEEIEPSTALPDEEHPEAALATKSEF